MVVITYYGISKRDQTHHLGNKDAKGEIMTWVSNVIGKEITEDNEADAVILALAGAIK